MPIAVFEQSESTPEVDVLYELHTKKGCCCAFVPSLLQWSSSCVSSVCSCMVTPSSSSSQPTSRQTCPESLSKKLKTGRGLLELLPKVCHNRTGADESSSNASTTVFDGLRTPTSVTAATMSLVSAKEPPLVRLFENPPIPRAHLIPDM